MTGSDFSELDSLVADLGRVPANAGPLIRAAIQVTAGKVKDSARASVAAGGNAWKRLPVGIDYDITSHAGSGGSEITAEIGYNKGRTGAAKLGVLREFGAPGATPALAPHLDLLNALHENEADFEAGLAQAIDDALGRAGI